ncbi:phage tail sheath C-terminal domain-containing protein [Enterobacter cloacae complex sp. I2]|uniref:phage tail sheath family protein n=1 Tax=Enterobacter cloacae complex sp. I2 TaxID=2779603 RepID=UPI0018672CB5|nr:phage tail sheath C-terminal domain-containing protein [Enterobacter cloacae complex sp. I2]EKS7425991.1 phage tail sheath subtilisin-like domain-containing protein [Enterobacter cancerogenus]MBE3510099.1 phage tail sheath subtilisin-like domain-containing protein [Enterobacter cloacae complex sp. I2]
MDLHGVRTKEKDSATKAVTNVNLSVIGLVGTAPDAEQGTAASLTTGSVLAGNALTFIAKDPGTAGNKLKVVMVAGEPTEATDNTDAAGANTAAAFADGVLTVTLGTDENGVVTATAAEVVDVINDLQDTGITAALYAGSAGDGVVTELAATQLSGGTDEPFPLYKPAIISGSKSKTKKLGIAGTLYADMQDILAQTGALVIVVRVEADEDEDKQRANILQGIEALQLAQGSTNYQPRILIAPEWSTDDGVGKVLESMATKLRAVTYLDSPSGATPVEVAQRAQKFGARVEMLRPRIMVTSDVTGESVSRPYSAAAAGHRVRIDSEKGWWWSKSNQTVLGFTGLEQVDTWLIGDENCVANQLNQENVSTIIQLDGFRHWGNRLCSSDPQWRFEAVRRTADMLQDSIQVMVTKNYLDRPIDKAFATALVGSANSYLRSQTKLGAINGGRCWLDPELNTAESLAAGKIYFNIAFGPKSPAEEITLTYAIDNTYTVTEVAA